MKTLTIIILATVLLFPSCGGDPEPGNKLDKFEVFPGEEIIKPAVDEFYLRANELNVTVEKGLRIKVVSMPQAGDQTIVEGKVISLDKEFISSMYIENSDVFKVFLSKQVGKVYFSTKLECVNKIDFNNISSFSSVGSAKREFIRSIVSPDPYPCPL